MRINEVDPRNFDSDIDYYAALRATPKRAQEPDDLPEPARPYTDKDAEEEISQQRQRADAKFRQKRKVEYVDQEGSAPNGQKHNKLYVIDAQDEATARHEEYLFDKHEWGAKKVVDTKLEKNTDGSVRLTLYIVDNHKYGLWRPWKDSPAYKESAELDEKAPPGMEEWINARKNEFKARYGDKWQQVLYATAWKRKKNESQDQGVAEGFKNTYSVGDRVDGPLGTGTIVAVSKNINVDGRVKVKLDDPSRAGEDGKYKDSFVLDTTQLKHISEQGVAEGQSPEQEIERLKLRQNAEHGGASLKRQAETQARIRELEKQIKDKKGMSESTDNPTDVICVDVPLFIRLMEYAREDASSDMDLHDVAERIIKLSGSGETVTMSSYDEIVGAQTEIKEADMDLEQGRKNIISILKASEQGQDAEIMIGGEPITLEYPEARYVGGRYKAFLKAGRQEEFLRALTDARQFDRIMSKMRAVLDKQKNFRGSVPGERGVGEGALHNAGQEDSPVAQAITRRILMQRTDLLAKHGPEKVGQAIDSVADFVGDVDEIGSSDVSGWIRQVERELDGVAEAAPGLVKAAAGLAVGGIAAAGAPAIVGILGPLLGIPMAAYGAYSAAKLGMKGVEKLWDMAADKLGGDDKVAQYTNSKIAQLPPEQKQAAAQVVKAVSESRQAKNPALAENQYWCNLDKQVKLIPEGYKKNKDGYLVRK